MIKYKTVTEEREIPVTFICDRCKREFDREKDWEEIGEVVRLCDIGGYNSIIGDGTKWKVDLCQYCLYDLCGQYMEIESE